MLSRPPPPDFAGKEKRNINIAPPPPFSESITTLAAPIMGYQQLIFISNVIKPNVLQEPYFKGHKNRQKAAIE